MVIILLKCSWFKMVFKALLLREIKGWLGGYGGSAGEKFTERNLKSGLDKNSYVIYRDLIVPSRNGTAQVDHLVVSPYGIFIVETKNRQGWIFGDANQPNWTQVNYRRKYHFQNPIRQTFRQKKVLAEFLGIRESWIHPVITFVGNCSFKTRMPDNVIDGDVCSYIKGFKNTMIAGGDFRQIEESLASLLEDTELDDSAHVASLQERHSSTTICPRCGSRLVERLARNGPNAGSIFLGCSSYPKCRFTKDLPKQASYDYNHTNQASSATKVFILLLFMLVILFILSV